MVRKIQESTNNMKSLEEKKLLVKMARMLGQPVDQELVESIEREEKLTKLLFKEEKKEIIGYEEGTTFLNRKPIIQEVVEPEPVFEPPFPTKKDMVDQVVNVLKTASPPAPAANVYRDKELDAIRKTLAEMMQKISTMSWGGGGTGVVRFTALDDHRVPTDINHIQLNTAQLPYTPPGGSLAWNTTEDCLNIYHADGSTLQTGLEQYIRVVNTGVTTLTNGTLVTFGGVDGGENPIAVTATANSTFNPIYTIGVLTNDIPAGETGRATTFGKVHNMNTTGSDVGETWALGDLLYMHPTQAGKLTKVDPTPPNAQVTVAAVTKVHATDGEILVRPVLIPRMYYASFSDTDPTTQTATAINTPQIVHITTVDISSGFSLGANSNVICQFAGLYNFQFSIQTQATSASKMDMYIWPRKNRQDVANSASVFSSSVNNGNAVAAWNFILPMDANDEFQLMWAVTDLALKVKGATTTGFCPAIPSLILTVTQVA